MIRLEKFKELYNFEPRYTFSELQQNLPQGFDSKIEDDRLYKTIDALAAMAYPTHEDDYEKMWRDFYVPLERRGYFISVPLAILLYDKRFFLSFPRSQIEVRRGKEKNEFYSGLIEQTVRFSRILKKAPDIIMETLPYDIRTGRVLGKYVMENLLPLGKKQKLLKLYSTHVKSLKRLQSISLEDYLNVLAICYKASFGKKTLGLTAEQMYRKWADGRDCGMMKIANKKSKRAFSYWLKNISHCGGHPFEIVFSWLGHGIHLYPPYTESPYFTLEITDYMYATFFLEMVKTLIRNGITYKASDLEGVLDYLSGESYFSVNAYDEHHIFYSSTDRKLLKHIEWDEPKMLKWKRGSFNR